MYKLSSQARLFKLLEVDTASLKAVPKELLYVRKWKHKRQDRWLQSPPSGAAQADYRPIDIPHPLLKKCQTRLAKLLASIETPVYLFNPVTGRSYVDNARAHLGAKAIWQLDIENYFSNCSEIAVAGFFQRHLKTAPGVTRALVKLVTLNGCLPQGSPCSPIIAFLCKIDMWNEIHFITSTSDLILSVYADDVTISGALVKKSTIWNIKKVIHKHGLRTKNSKELSSINRPTNVTGVIVNGTDLRLPNKQHKAISQLRSMLRTESDPIQTLKLKNRLSGYYNQKSQVLSAKLPT